MNSHPSVSGNPSKATAALDGQVVAYRTLDCRHKQRLHFQLPLTSSGLDDGFLQCFPDDQIERHDFSQYVSGGKVQFVIRRPGCFHIAGVLTDHRIVATLAKDPSRPGIGAEHAIAEIEAALSTLGFGSVVYIESQDQPAP